jgi:hypothetical protein
MESTSRPVRGALAVGAALSVLSVPACGSHPVARQSSAAATPTKAATPTPAATSSKVALPHPAVRVTYRDRTAPDEGSETGPIRYDVLSAGDRLVRVTMQTYSDLAMTEPDERFVFTWDGTRLLEYDSGADPRYTVYDAPRDHPEAWDLVSDWTSPPPRQEPGRDCTRLAARRTVIGRDVVGYSCRYAATPDGDAFTDRLWVDRQTGVPLLTSLVRAEKLVENPRVDEAAFSTRPPAGAAVNSDPASP